MFETTKEMYVAEFRANKTPEIKLRQTQLDVLRKKREKLERELKEQDIQIASVEQDIAEANAANSNEEEIAKKLLLRDFRREVSALKSAEPGSRYGLRISHRDFQEPRMVGHWDGTTTTHEVEPCRIREFRSNQAALEKFHTYLSKGLDGLDIAGMTFNQLWKAMEKFFEKAPKLDVYGEKWEEVSPLKAATPNPAPDLFHAPEKPALERFEEFKEKWKGGTK